MGTRSRQGNHMDGMSNTLGPNHDALSGGGPTEQQSAPMELPVGSVVANAPMQPLSHHPAQFQSQSHFQQPLPSPRMYQSFAEALADSPQPLTGPSMHSMNPHGTSQGFFSRPQSAQGMTMASQGLPSQAHFGQGHLQSHLFQGSSQQGHGRQDSSLQTHAGQGPPLQPQPGQAAEGFTRNGYGSSLTGNGIIHGQSLPDGVPQLSSHVQGKLWLPTESKGC